MHSPNHGGLFNIEAFTNTFLINRLKIISVCKIIHLNLS